MYELVTVCPSGLIVRSRYGDGDEARQQGWLALRYGAAVAYRVEWID